MNRDLLNEVIDEMRAELPARLGSIIDNLIVATDPGEPPVLGAIPLEGVNGEPVWVSRANGEDFTSTGAYLHMPYGKRTILQIAKLVADGLRVPEPPRQFERYDKATPIDRPAITLEVLADQVGAEVWVRDPDTGETFVDKAEYLRLVDEATR